MHKFAHFHALNFYLLQSIIKLREMSYAKTVSQEQATEKGFSKITLQINIICFSFTCKKPMFNISFKFLCLEYIGFNYFKSYINSSQSLNKAYYLLYCVNKHKVQLKISRICFFPHKIPNVPKFSSFYSKIIGCFSAVQNSWFFKSLYAKQC